MGAIGIFIFGASLALVQGKQPGSLTPQGRLWEPHPGCANTAGQHWLLEHEWDCTKFYYCEYGLKRIEPTDCAPGTHFSYEKQVCVHIKDSDCRLSNEPSTAAPPIEPPTASPQYSTESPSTGSDVDSEEFLPNGCPADFEVHYLLPHENECNKFYYCVFGQLVERTCASGTYFNPALQVCDWPENVDCANSGGGNDCNGEDCDNGGGEGGTLENGCPADWNIHQLLPHENNCSKFYYCVHGNLVERECADGLHFNLVLQVCDWPGSAGCQAGGGCTGCPESGSGENNNSSDSNEAPIGESGEKDSEEDNGGESNESSIDDSGEKDSEEEGDDNAGATTVFPDVEDSNEDNGNGSCSENCPSCPGGCVTETPDERCKNNCNIPPFAHGDCDKYWRCDGDKAVLVTCSEGLHFNPTTFTCDFICYAGCVRETVQTTNDQYGVRVYLPWNTVTPPLLELIELAKKSEL